MQEEWKEVKEGTEGSERRMEVKEERKEVKEGTEGSKGRKERRK